MKICFFCMTVLLSLSLSGSSAELFPGKDFKKADMDGYQIQPGSPLDISNILEKHPAGTFGFLQIGKNGMAEFEKRPGVPQRFNGFNAMPQHPRFALPRRKIKDFIRQMRISGYNCLRLSIPYNSDTLSPQGEVSLEPEKQDYLDFFIAELKKNGIYVQFILGLNRFGKDNTKYAWINMNNLKLRMFLGDPEVRDYYRKLSALILNHVNPYTELAYKDDPVFLAMECYNEQEFGLERIRNTSPELQTQYKQRLGEFTETLRKTCPNMTQPQMEERFRRSLVQENLRWYRHTLREIGWKGLISQYNYSKRLSESEVRFGQSDIVTFNTYFCHPGGNWSNGTGHILQHSSIGEAAKYLRNMAGIRLVGRPLSITEHNHCFWNPYQYEDALVFPSYTSLQNFTTTLVHSDAVVFDPQTKIMTPFSVGHNPVSRANELLHALIFMRQDAAPAAHRIVLEVSSDFLAQNRRNAVNDEQTKLSLLCGFSIDFPEQRTKYPKNSIDFKLPATGSSGVYTDPWFSDVVTSNDKNFSMTKTGELLRRRNILPSANQTNPAQGIFESDTGEILLNQKQKVLTLRTPRTEGAAIPAGTPVALPVLTVKNSSCDAAIALSSLDGKPLGSARRMMLFIITRAMNSDMKLKDDGRQLSRLGRPPVLLRSGIFKLEFRRLPFSSLKIRPVSINGMRRTPVSAVRVDDSWVLNLDTATLENGPTPFFEIEAEGKL